MLPLTYLLPIRSLRPCEDELTEHLRAMSDVCPVVVVDGSPPHVFEHHHGAWAGLAVHVAPEPALRCANGKVHGVLTGLTWVSTPLVIIADDDVRYCHSDLERVVDALDHADLVVPQNYFSPLPWHARWDTARTLLNRVVGGDFPGTLALRMNAVRTSGGYDGNVLFENLELMRTVEAVGGLCAKHPDLYVRRAPPSTRHFLSQRVRQAYDEFARPARMMAWLVMLPMGVVVGRRFPAAVALAVALSIAIAEVGRRSSGGRVYFPATSSLLAPAWVVERSFCSWLALTLRLRGGVPYAGGRIVRAATSPRRLRQRHAPADLRGTSQSKQWDAAATMGYSWNNGNTRVGGTLMRERPT